MLSVSRQRVANYKNNVFFLDYDAIRRRVNNARLQKYFPIECFFYQSYVPFFTARYHPVCRDPLSESFGENSNEKIRRRKQGLAASNVKKHDFRKIHPAGRSLNSSDYKSPFPFGLRSTRSSRFCTASRHRNVALFLLRFHRPLATVFGTIDRFCLR